jgi:hypothetical protein
MQHLAVKSMRAPVVQYSHFGFGSVTNNCEKKMQGSEIQSGSFTEKSAQYSVDTMSQKAREFEREPRDRRWR